MERVIRIRCPSVVTVRLRHRITFLSRFAKRCRAWPEAAANDVTTSSRRGTTLLSRVKNKNDVCNVCAVPKCQQWQHVNSRRLGFKKELWCRSHCSSKNYLHVLVTLAAEIFISDGKIRIFSKVSHSRLNRLQYWHLISLLYVTESDLTFCHLNSIYQWVLYMAE